MSRGLLLYPTDLADQLFRKAKWQMNKRRLSVFLELGGLLVAIIQVPGKEVFVFAFLAALSANLDLI